MNKLIILVITLTLVMLAFMGSTFDNSFVGSIALYEATGELYMVYAGQIENLSLGDGGVRFTFEGHDYTYLNYFVEIVR